MGIERLFIVWMGWGDWPPVISWWRATSKTIGLPGRILCWTLWIGPILIGCGQETQT